VLGFISNLDGKEYKATQAQTFTSLRYFEPKQGWREHITLSDDADSFPPFLIPQKAMTPGRHKIALREARAESNTLTIFFEIK
jgi:hypothetical protein